MNQQPNVLFILSDQHKQQVTGCYGDPLVRTPHLDRLGDEGMRFDNAYCQSPLCGPSRASIMTGTYPQTSGVFNHDQPEPMRYLPTLGDVFRRQGYTTGAIGKVHVAGEDRRYRDLGFDERQLRIYTYNLADYIDLVGLENVYQYASYVDHFKDRPGRNVYNPDNRPIEMDPALLYDTLVVDRCVGFLERNRQQPFFLWAGLEKPHPEWYAPAAFHAMYDPGQMTVPASYDHPPDQLPATAARLHRWGHWGPRFSHDQVRASMAAYYANVSYLDDQIGRLLASLDALGLSDNTIVVYASDHGEHLFEHGLTQKHCFFDSAAKVPLIVRWPGHIPAGAVSTALVELIDLFPTFTDFCDIPAPPTLEGTSLRPLVDQPADPGKDAVFSEFYAFGTSERMIRTQRYKYVHTVGDRPQLYDSQEDPLEICNLADRADMAPLCRELEVRVLENWRRPPAHVLARD